MLLGVILDSGKRYPEAETFYNRALQLAPRAVPLLNNLGNHYLAAGVPKRAEGFYRRVAALDPQHANANLHLAEMRVADKHGAEALAHLDRLRPAEQAEPVAQLLRGQALALSNRCAEAAAVLDPLQQRTAADSSFSFSIGLSYAACKRYEQAEASFSRALETDPSNFDVLYNLGLVARHAGHLDRARRVFEIALNQRPDEPDALYGLAEVLAKTGDGLTAVTVLYRLRRLAPERADVLLLLAHTAEELGYFEESATAYREYLKLRPKDDVARRELGFAMARTGNGKDALPLLAAFVQVHPKDPRGQYELAIAEALTDHRKALRRFDQALALEPSLAQARYARAVLHFEEDEFAPARADFEALLQRDPESAQLLDWVGQIDLFTGRPQEAADVLKRAVARAPRDRAVLMHYSRALRELNRDGELADVLAAFQRLSADRDIQRRQRRGLFDFLALSPEEQRTKYLNFLQGAVKVNPSDAILKTRWASALLEQGRTEEAAAVFREILALAPDATVLARCGSILMRYEQYALAAEFLSSVPGSRLDLAIALFHSGGPQAGLAELEKIPPGERQGDYYLLRAQILEASGKLEEAADSLNHGIRAAPTRADMYFQGAVFLIKHGRTEDAGKLLADATRLLPDASELLLARAITLELLNRTDEALKLLAQIQSRWPEWDRSYLIQGIILANSPEPGKAKQVLETAIALGAREPDAYYSLALAIRQATPEKLDEAQKAVLEAVELSPEDFSIRWLAGKILLDAKRFAPALEHASAAVRLQPQSARAHYLLLAVYRAVGDEQKSEAEAKLIEKLTQLEPQREQPSPLEHILSTLRPPG